MFASISTWRRPLLAVGSMFFLYFATSLLMGGYYVLAVMSDHYLSDQTLYCSSPAEARAAGVFIDTVLVEPRLVRYGDYQLEFDNCWVYQLRNSHRPAWDEARTQTRLPRAAFTLRYRVTYLGSKKEAPEDSPLLECEQDFGGHFIGQDPSQQLTVLADLLPGNRTSIDLPLDLSLTGRLPELPKRCFTAYPAHFQPLAHQ